MMKLLNVLARCSLGNLDIIYSISLFLAVTCPSVHATANGGFGVISFVFYVKMKPDLEDDAPFSLENVEIFSTSSLYLASLAPDATVLTGIWKNSTHFSTCDELGSCGRGRAPHSTSSSYGGGRVFSFDFTVFFGLRPFGRRVPAHRGVFGSRR